MERRKDPLAIAECPKCGTEFRERSRAQIGKSCGTLRETKDGLKPCDGIVAALAPKGGGRSHSKAAEE